MRVPFRPRAALHFLLSGLDANKGSGQNPASVRLLTTGNSGTDQLVNQALGKPVSAQEGSHNYEDADDFVCLIGL